MTFIRTLFTFLGLMSVSSAFAHEAHTPSETMTHHVLEEDPSSSQEEKAHAHHTHEEGKNTLTLTLIPQGKLDVDKTIPIRLRITSLRNGAPIKAQDLNVVHENRVHLLAIDSSLTDYHHIHPRPTNINGEWIFDLTPRKKGPYRIWIDVMPSQTMKHEYIKADLGDFPFAPQSVDRTAVSTVHAGGYTFTLYFDEPLVAGKDAIGRITVFDKEQKPVTFLEPVMGAFAHIIGFEENGNSILHMHPMGREPTNNRARGGPELSFHMGAQKSGFVKLFIQTRIHEKEQVIPLAIHIP